jgi:hypothetical protein
MRLTTYQAVAGTEGCGWQVGVPAAVNAGYIEASPVPEKRVLVKQI